MRRHNSQSADWQRRFQHVSFDPASSNTFASSAGEQTSGCECSETPSPSHCCCQAGGLIGSATTTSTSAASQGAKPANMSASAKTIRDCGSSGSANRSSAVNNEGDLREKSSAKTSAPVGNHRELGAKHNAVSGHKKQNLRQESARRARREHPLDAASLISKLFFGWMFPFIWRGWQVGLRQADMPDKPSKEEGCHKIGQRLAAFWLIELQGASGRPSLARAVVRAHARWILLNSLLTFFSEVVCKSLSAYSVGQMLLHMNKRELADYSRPWSLEDPLLFWTVSLISAVCCWVLTAHFYGFQMMRVGLHVRVGCSYLIYRKSLKLAQYESSSQTTMGKMVNLLSNDLDKFNYVCIMLPFLWVGPIQTVVSLYLLWPLLGPACLGSLFVLTILTPIQFYLSRKFASFRRRIAAYTDERVRLLNETITALQLIKLYAWEYPFRAAMAESRRRETDLISRVGIIKGISTALMYVSSKLVLFVTIIFHTLLFGTPLDAKTLFMSMAMLNNVQFTMTQLLPRVVSLGVESLVSLGRIRDFLLTEEFVASDKLSAELVHNEVVRSNSSTSSCTVNTAHDINKLMPRQEDLYKRAAFVDCQNVGARWPSAETRTIEGFSFRCESPGLIIICGQVASGKSSLFMALLNELPIREGRAKIRGSLSYSSQVPWIFNGTVRDNIIFGYGYNKRRYEQVLEVCALKRDLELLEYGDFTYIQENSLSGGQKARVNLARSLYRECDIYMLDDPFSAIDDRVANHIFEEAIVKFLSGKLVLLTTHQTRFLKRSQRVLLLDQGKQLAFCGYNELLLNFNSGNHFNRDQLERLSFIIEELEEEFVDGEKTKTANDNRGKKSPEFTKVRGPPSAIPITKQFEGNAESRSARVKKAVNDLERLTDSLAVGTRCPIVKGLSETTSADGGQLERTSSDKQEERTESISDEPCNLCANGRLCGSHGDCDKTSILDPATSESIHAPYGFASLLVYNGDKTLITVPEAASSAGQAKPVSAAATVNSQAKEGSRAGGALLAKHEVQPTDKVCTTVDGRRPGIANSTYRTTISQVQPELKKEKTLPVGKVSNKNIPDESAASVGNFSPRDGQPASEETSCSRLPGLSVWYKYYTQTSVIRLVLIILTFMTTQALLSTVDIYLTVWSLVEQNRALIYEVTASNQQHLNSFKLVAHINHHQHHHGTANKTNIEYDLMARGGNLPAAFMSSVVDHHNNSDDEALEMAHEIHRVGISPLSFWTSQLPMVMPMNNLFVPLVNLFYAATTSTGAYNSTATTDLAQFQQVSSSRSENTPPPSSEGTLMVDRNIFEESEAALNVKSIYRPLYLFVNNFTSGHHAIAYTLLLMVLFSCSAITNVLSLTSSNKSAITLYAKLTDNALFAKLAFFDQNPVGRFLNRATRDIGIIDEAIPYNANQAYDALLQTAATFIVVALVDINLAVPSLIILFIFLIYHSIHVKPTKDIQRYEGISRSPIISHISTTLTGLHTIRATKSEHRFEQLFIRHQDAHTSIFLLYLGCNRSMAVVLDSLNATYTGIIAFWAVVSGLAGPSAGLIITSAMLLSGLTQHGVMKLTETESLMTSVERVIEYCSLPQEESYDGSGKRRCNGGGGDCKGAKVWMKEACVEYKNVDLYYNKAEKPVLKNISFKLSAGEKIGVVGRTGAGKSSIITTLFRLYDFDGTILIDGVNTKKLDLLDLRSAIGIIPQNPVVFSTSVRKNLDPFNIYDDFSIWAALDKAHLRETVSALPGKLNHTIGSGGGGFSSGQKQLICLARVLLRQNSLIVMDEATANVDPNTDAIIQSTIRREFKHCTVITIAHRLETILDCDRIMVLEAGRIVDFDTPERLVAKGNSHFASLVAQKS